MAFDVNLSLKTMVRPRLLVKNHSKIETSQLLHVAGFGAVFIEESYLIGEGSNASFSQVNLPCYVAALCGVNYVRPSYETDPPRWAADHFPHLARPRLRARKGQSCPRSHIVQRLL